MQSRLKWPDIMAHLGIGQEKSVPAWLACLRGSKSGWAGETRLRILDFVHETIEAERQGDAAVAPQKTPVKTDGRTKPGPGDAA